MVVLPLTDDSNAAHWDRKGTCAFNVRMADLAIEAALALAGCTAALQGAPHGID